MIDRNELHRLVDTLPDEVLEPVQRVLERLQTWPPPTPPEVERIRQENLERMGHSIRQGRCGTSGESGHYSFGADGKIEGGCFSQNYWEDKTEVSVAHRFHAGHELTITERLWLENDAKVLVYSQEILGPKGEAERRETRFMV